MNSELSKKYLVLENAIAKLEEEKEELRKEIASKVVDSYEDEFLTVS